MVDAGGEDPCGVESVDFGVDADSSLGHMALDVGFALLMGRRAAGLDPMVARAGSGRNARFARDRVRALRERKERRNMAIKAGDKLPSVILKRLGKDGMDDVSTDELTKGRKVVIFSVPGAFTPTCSQTHLPGYVDKADDLKAKGVDEICCLAVNDPFVMDAWAKSANAEGKVSMLPDGNGELTKALGLEMDGSGAGLGTRGKRFSMIVNDGVVESLDVEDNPGAVEVSGADVCMTKL